MTKVEKIMEERKRLLLEERKQSEKETLNFYQMLLSDGFLKSWFVCQKQNVFPITLVRRIPHSHDYITEYGNKINLPALKVLAEEEGFKVNFQEGYDEKNPSGWVYISLPRV